MTSLTVRCILQGMEQNEWTEQQLIDFAHSNNYTEVTSRVLKRYRYEKVLPEVTVMHPDFGETRTLYPPSAGPQLLAVCQLMREKRNFDVVRFRLWERGYAIDLPLLKKSVWNLVPFHSWTVPSKKGERSKKASQQAKSLWREAWKSVRGNMLRSLLKVFQDKQDQLTFLDLQTRMLYGLENDFTPTFLNTYDANLQEELELADFVEKGLRLEQMQPILTDIPLSEAMQRLSDEQLFSLTNLQAALEAATEGEMELAHTRLRMIEELFEVLELRGYLAEPLHFYGKVFVRPAMQALFLVSFLLLEQRGYGSNMETVFEAIRLVMSRVQQLQALRLALQQELPDIAEELLPLQQIGRFRPEQFDTYAHRLLQVYQQHKEELDAFFERHPELREPSL